jgi:hypothetical protein
VEPSDDAGDRTRKSQNIETASEAQPTTSTYTSTIVLKTNITSAAYANLSDVEVRAFSDNIEETLNSIYGGIYITKILPVVSIPQNQQRASIEQLESEQRSGLSDLYQSEITMITSQPCDVYAELSLSEKEWLELDVETEVENLAPQAAVTRVAVLCSDETTMRVRRGASRLVVTITAVFEEKELAESFGTHMLREVQEKERFDVEVGRVAKQTSDGNEVVDLWLKNT